MTGDLTGYRERIRAGLARVLIEAGHEPGEPVALIDASAAADELLTAIALVIHSGEECRTSAGVRRVSERMAKRLRARVLEVQQVMADGGLSIETRGTVQ